MTFADEAEKPALNIVGHKLSDAIFGHLPRLGNAGYLEEGAVRRNVGVETASRCGHQVDRHGGRRILLLQ